MTDTTLTIALATAIFTALVFIDVLRANRSQPLFGPSLRHRDEQGSGDVNAELDGGRLPARIINKNHIEGINP
jgi:hypothetical protein